VGRKFTVLSAEVLSLRWLPELKRRSFKFSLGFLGELDLHQSGDVAWVGTRAGGWLRLRRSRMRCGVKHSFSGKCS
jgi:hypothetical protein